MEDGSNVRATLAANTLVIRLVGDDDVVLARTFESAADVDLDVSGVDVEAAPTVLYGAGINVGTVELEEWTRICIQDTGCTVSGTFRADLNPSQGGVDRITIDGLIDDWFTENRGFGTTRPVIDGVDAGL